MVKAGSGTGCMWLQRQSIPDATASSLCLLAVSSNICLNGSFLSPDSWRTFIPLSLWWTMKLSSVTVDSLTRRLNSENADWEIWHLLMLYIISNQIKISLLILCFLHPQIMICYYGCTLPPFLEFLHESSHVGVVYVLCFSSCLSNMDSLCRVTVVTQFKPI